MTDTVGTGPSRDVNAVPRPGTAEARTAQQPHRVQLSESPGELIAAIPALLFFIPVDSVVITALTSDRAPRSVEIVLRQDPPTPEIVPATLRRLSRTLDTHHTYVDIVEVLIVGCATADAVELPHREFVDQLIQFVQDAGVAVGNALWAERIEPRATWRSYTDSTQTGTVAELAQSTVTGGMVYASRAEFAAQLAADPQEDLDRRASLLPGLPPIRPKKDFSMVCATVDRIGTDLAAQRVLDDNALVRLGHALTHPDVREACLEFALTERGVAAEELWLLLTRALPRSMVAIPAALLAVSAYLHGEGALAMVAIETALAANPDDRLANIVSRLLNVGLSPKGYRQLLTEAFEATRTEIKNRPQLPQADRSEAEICNFW